MTDPTERPIGIPALLQAARRAYGKRIRAALAEVDCDDIPANGIYVIGAIARGNIPMANIIESLGVTKQAAGQLIDTLVLRGYLLRAEDPEDRRRLKLTLTPRGEAAAAASTTVIGGMQTTIIDRLSLDHLTKTREVLLTLMSLGDEAA